MDFMGWLKASRLFFSEVKQEVRCVIWPTRRDVVLTSIIVLILAALFSVFLFATDVVILHLRHAFLGISHG